MAKMSWVLVIVTDLEAVVEREGDPFARGDTHRFSTLKAAQEAQAFIKACAGKVVCTAIVEDHDDG
jgi:hypothetical protein